MRIVGETLNILRLYDLVRESLNVKDKHGRVKKEEEKKGGSEHDNNDDRKFKSKLCLKDLMVIIKASSIT